MTPAARTARLFRHVISREVGTRPRRVALLLGGGVDSQTVGLAAHSLGHTVHAYTFQLGDTPSHDSHWARRTSETMGWEWTCVRLPTDRAAVLRAWPRMYAMGCRKKREFECTWPFLWVYPAVRERHVLNGLHAGKFFGLSRTVSKLRPREDREAFDAYRRETAGPLARLGDRALTPEYNPSCMLQHRILERECGLVDVNPFVTPEAYRHFLAYSWDELNKPKQKSILRDAFPEDTRRVGARNHRGYQEAGGIIKHFELLLNTPVNFMRRGRMLDLYADWWRPCHAERARETIERICRHYNIEPARPEIKQVNREHRTQRGSSHRQR